MSKKNQIDFEPSGVSGYLKPSLVTSLMDDIKRRLLDGGPEMIKKRFGRFFFDGVQTELGVLPIAIYAVWDSSTDGELGDCQILKYQLNPDEQTDFIHSDLRSDNLNWESVKVVRHQVQGIKNRLWELQETLRKEPISSGEYVVILYLITLLRSRISLKGNKQRDGSIRVELQFAEVVKAATTPLARALKPFHVIHEVFRPTLEKLSSSAVQEFYEVSESIDRGLLDETFPEIFDDLLYRINSYQGRLGGEYMQPIELSRFACGLAGLKPNSSIYNPFAGVASFALSFNDGQHYLGQEINRTTWAIGLLRMMAYEEVKNAEFTLGDSIINWNPKNQKYDLIIATPPFGMRLPGDVIGKFGQIRTCEHFLIEKGVDDLTPDGKLIVVISNGFLFRGGSERRLREFLVDHDLLEMVISIPGGLFANTEIPVAVLVINKVKKEKGRVRVIDGRRFVSQSKRRHKRLNDYGLNSATRNDKESNDLRIVSNTEIAGADFDFSVPRYFAPKFDGTALRDFASVIRGQRTTETNKGKFIRIRNLKDDNLNFWLDVSAVEVVELPRHAQLITESCLLVATRWKTLKPTFFDFTGDPIFISPDILALRIDALKVDPDFLVKELSADYTNEQLELYRNGSIIPNIKSEDLLNVKIRLIPIEEQRANVRGVLAALADEKKRELLLFNKIHGLESEIIEQNTYLRHTLAGPTSNLKDSLANLRKIIDEKVAPKIPDVAKLKVSDSHLLCFGQYMDVLERDINKISEAVSKQLKVETEIASKVLSPIDITAWISEFAREYADKKELGFELKLDFDKEVFQHPTSGELVKTYILANVDLLSNLFHNLIDNAVTHAFPGASGIQRIELYLTFVSQNEICILVSNTGKPLPQNFDKADFVRKGAKGGPSGGDGFGGWYINEVVKRLNGALDINDETVRQDLSDRSRILGGDEYTLGSDLSTSFKMVFEVVEPDDDEEV